MPPIDKDKYFKKLSRTGSRPETKNQEVILEVLVDLLDYMHDIKDVLVDIKEALQAA